MQKKYLEGHQPERDARRKVAGTVDVELLLHKESIIERQWAIWLFMVVLCCRRFSAPNPSPPKSLVKYLLFITAFRARE